MGKYTNAVLNEVLGHFKIAKKSYAISPLTDGFINDTFLVLDGTVPLYVLQRINHNVFRNVHGLMKNVQYAFGHLEGSDYRQITLLPTTSGNTFYERKGQDVEYWRLMTYIDGTVAHNTTTDPKIAFEAGRIIGKFHVLLSEAEVGDYVDTIPKFHNLNFRKQQFLEALQTANPEKLEIAKDAIGFAHHVLKILQPLSDTKLPMRICHNDTKLNNILFSRAANNALCLIDLDTIMKGYFYYDFGDAIRTIANTAPEDEQDHSKITFEKPLFEAFVKGLSTNGAFLYKKELETLPLGAVFMPFLHGIRALTDYLNNNIYYKVAYENQNLDRCLSIFNFTQKALNEVDYMKSVVGHGLVVLEQ